MKLRRFFSLMAMILAIGVLGTSCVKEGPPGKDGDKGDTGDGTDANETCKLCHNPAVVDQKNVEFTFSKHHYGEAAFAESGATGCAACHTHMGFLNVVKNNTSSAFVLNSTTGKYTNPYAVPASESMGEFNCFTCHSSLHTTYGYEDFSPLTTVAAVPLNMWSATKTVNLTPDGGSSNLCVKCHQPRPVTKSTDGNIIDYNALRTNPTASFFSPGATTNVLNPAFRTGVHYGTVGAIYAGTGGIEFTGPMAYANAVHPAKASCSDCHQAPLTGKAGGHTFFAKGNFNGCNTTDCHGATPVTASSAKYWVNPRASIKLLLDQLGAKLAINGVEIMKKDPDAEHNLWAANTTKKYDGYLDIYDPTNNPGAAFRNPNPSGSWTQAAKDANATLPVFTLTNAQMGAIINFQLCLREYSLGIHNLDYTKALLTNSIAILP